MEETAEQNDPRALRLSTRGRMRALEPDHPQGPRPPQLQPDSPAGRPDVREVTVPHWEQVATSPASGYRLGLEGKCPRDTQQPALSE